VLCVHSEIFERPHETRLIRHPRYPYGCTHFLHPSPLFRAEVSIKIPGVPFTLSVLQRQTFKDRGDDTGFACWRASTVLASYLVVHRNTFAMNISAIELGCGVGAIVSSVAAWLGFEVDATDGSEQVLIDAQNSIDVAAQASGYTVKCIFKFEWNKEQADHLVKSRGGKKYQLILGSEIVYSLRSQSASLAHANFSQLVATLDALLADDGQILLAWNPRSQLESIFYDILFSYNLLSSPLDLNMLNLHHAQTDGIKLIRITRRFT